MATSMRRRRARTASSATIDDAAADAAPTKGRRDRLDGGTERKGPLLERLAHAATLASGTSMAFALAVAVVAVWVVTGPLFGFSDTWQLVINTGTTIVTFLMVFLIQNSQNRDGAAMQAKLDELLRAVDQAREQFIGIEHLTDQQIELVRTALERHAKELRENQSKKKTTADTVDRLLDRF